jgi:hypothetical protein
MIRHLSKEQIAQLSPDEQELMARLALDEARSRRDLLARAKGYRGVMLVPALLWVVAAGLGMWNPSVAGMLPYLVLMTLILVQFHALGVNSRIDAMIRLLNLDHSPESPKPAEQVVPPHRSDTPSVDANSSAREAAD